MRRRPYTKGLHDLGNGLWAYLQPDGGWGWSNAGLIVDGDRSLLVDTLFDLKLTREMLDAMRRATPAAAVDRHAGQHPRQRRSLLRQPAGRRRAHRHLERERARDGGGRARRGSRSCMRQATELGEMGDYLRRIFGAFEFDGITIDAAHRDLRRRDHARGRRQGGRASTRWVRRTRRATCWCTCPAIAPSSPATSCSSRATR